MVSVLLLSLVAQALVGVALVARRADALRASAFVLWIWVLVGLWRAPTFELAVRFVLDGAVILLARDVADKCGPGTFIATTAFVGSVL